MKSLTVCQPYAHLIIHCDKRIENRTRPTKYRGQLAIHAGKSEKWIEPYLFNQTNPYPRVAIIPELVFGAIIGTVDLVDCVPLEKVEGQPYAGGPWCWILENPRPLSEPIPWKGQLGLFNVPDDVIKGQAA